MEEPPLTLFLQVFNPALSGADWVPALLNGAIIVLLIFLSAVFSGSENAFFSLSQPQFDELTENPGQVSKSVSFLNAHPKKLLATILIANTFVNIAIVVISAELFTRIFDFSQNPLLGFLIEVVLVTFMIVLLGEVIPKIYSFQNNIRVARFVAVPMYSLYKVLQPLVYLLESTTAIIDKRVTKRGHILSIDELTHAIEITSEKDAPKQEKNILKGIVNFGNTTVKQIMRQRPDVLAVNLNLDSDKLMKQIIDSGYSRVPVYEGSLDQIKGILFIKDLLPYLYQNDFDWKQLIRPAFFVPESKKIDDLLKEFQTKRMHLAIVIDEFGGTSGLITMEDILEEIFGEIHDEFDEEEQIFTRINEHTFVFEAKILINDFCRYMEVDSDEFEEVRKDSDTLGGMLLELNGDLPTLGQEITYGPYTFKVESVDKRRIKRVKVTILHGNNETTVV
ncbi:gliding motility-associated protein GldE [Bacteroidota bacterium]